MDPSTSDLREKVKHLVVDSGAFINNVPIQELGTNIYTLPDVIKEIKDRSTKQRLQFLPYSLNFREPSSEIIKFITDFSKKTGDYPSLSPVDIRVLALTYLLEKENVGTDHLKKEPNKTQIVSQDTKNSEALPPGFTVITKQEQSCLSAGELNDEDENGWITPGNIQEMKKQIDQLKLDETPVKVACITTDFAMQNMLIQIGLNLLSLDGKVIRQARTYILRCHACFELVKDVTKQFCPSCGNKTLKRVSVSVDENGRSTVYINFKKPINIRGTKFSLPMPKGGKHANNPVLFEDQPIPQNKPSKLALKKVNALDPDYEALDSPFRVNDVYSKSSRLGIGKNFARNPNQSWRNTGNHKKRHL